MSRPFFSIIIPTLNEEKYLPNLLTDLATQSFRDFEAVIVDGHSDDRTPTITKKFSSLLPALKIVNCRKRHVCVQRNLGAKQALADTLIFMDADNRLPSYFLQGIKYRCESDPADIATTYVDSDPTYKQSLPIVQAMNTVIDLTSSSQHPLVNESLLIIPKHILKKVGGFDEKLQYAEGYHLLQTALALKLSFKVYKDPTYVYSLRRVKKYGLLKTYTILTTYGLSQLLKLPLTNQQIKSMYPMEGGSAFSISPKNKQKFTELMRYIINNVKNPDKIRLYLEKLSH